MSDFHHFYFAFISILNLFSFSVQNWSKFFWCFFCFGFWDVLDCIAGPNKDVTQLTPLPLPWCALGLDEDVTYSIMVFSWCWVFFFHTRAWQSCDVLHHCVSLYIRAWQSCDILHHCVSLYIRAWQSCDILHDCVCFYVRTWQRHHTFHRCVFTLGLHKHVLNIKAWQVSVFMSGLDKDMTSSITVFLHWGFTNVYLPSSLDKCLFKCQGSTKNDVLHHCDCFYVRAWQRHHTLHHSVFTLGLHEHALNIKAQQVFVLTSGLDKDVTSSITVFLFTSGLHKHVLNIKSWQMFVFMSGLEKDMTSSITVVFLFFYIRASQRCDILHHCVFTPGLCKHVLNIKAWQVFVFMSGLDKDMTSSITVFVFISGLDNDVTSSIIVVCFFTSGLDKDVTSSITVFFTSGFDKDTSSITVCVLCQGLTKIQHPPSLCLFYIRAWWRYNIPHHCVVFFLHHGLAKVWHPPSLCLFYIRTWWRYNFLHYCVCFVLGFDENATSSIIVFVLHQAWLRYNILYHCLCFTSGLGKDAVGVGGGHRGGRSKGDHQCAAICLRWLGSCWCGQQTQVSFA